MSETANQPKTAISKRRVLANKRNAALSTGPRTVQGKLISRNNALRHGLTRPVASDAAAADQVEALTRVLARSTNDVLHQEVARELAESLIDLQRIRNACWQILDKLGEFAAADLHEHEWAASQLERIWRYQQRAYARHVKVLRAFS